MNLRRWVFLFFVVVCGSLPLRAQSRPSVFEDLGIPVKMKTNAFVCVTRDDGGHYIAWAHHEFGSTNAMLGFRIDTGEMITVDVSEFGFRQILPFVPASPSGSAGSDLYLFTGIPGRFLKFNVNTRQLTELGTPSKAANYWLRGRMAPDGKFYVGTYPLTELVRCDPATDKVENLGRVTTDPAQCYILDTVVGSDGVAFCTVGKHHSELWSVNLNTGTRTQILPADLIGRGRPDVSIWLGTDGQVYGSLGNDAAGGKIFFRCMETGIARGETKPADYDARRLTAGDKTAVGLVDGRVVIKDTKTGLSSSVESSYTGTPVEILDITCERDGKIFGGCVAPAHSFCYDPKSGAMTDFGQVATSRVQIYDTLSHPKGLFLSSYTPANLDFFNPDTVEKRHVLEVPGQERPQQLCLGPDGMIYSGTAPLKGQLGNSLVKIDPDRLTTKVWRDVSHADDPSLSKQSILGLASLPESNQLVCSTSISGGSSAIPEAREACIFFWDCQKETIASVARPIPGARRYDVVTRDVNGRVVGTGDGRFYVFDPASQTVARTGALPVRSVVSPVLNRVPRGPKGLIYGVGDGALFAIDPTTNEAAILGRDPALKSADCFYVSEDEHLYIGVGPSLKRCRISGLRAAVPPEAAAPTLPK